MHGLRKKFKSKKKTTLKKKKKRKMKKFIFSLIMTFAMSIGVNAQNHIEGSTVLDNWFVGASVGVSAPQTHAFDWAQHSSWIQLYRPNIAVEIGKNFTPITTLSVSEEVRINTTGAKTAFDTNYLWGNLRFNIMNLFGGYGEEPRTFEVNVGPSIGWLHLFGTEGLARTNYAAYRVTVSFDWNLGKEKQWQINLRPNLTYADSFRASNGTFGVNAGVTYKLNGHKSGARNFVRCKLVDPAELDENIKIKNSLMEEIKGLRSELEACNSNNLKKDALIKGLEAEASVVESDTLPQAIYFEKNKAAIVPTTENIIADLAEYLVANPSVNVFVNGYADKGTGTAKYNMTLSEVRAKNVSAILQKHGVNASRITVQGKGDVEQPFTVNDKNRVVLTLINMN